MLNYVHSAPQWVPGLRRHATATASPRCRSFTRCTTFSYYSQFKFSQASASPSQNGRHLFYNLVPARAGSSPVSPTFACAPLGPTIVQAPCSSSCSGRQGGGAG